MSFMALKIIEVDPSEPLGAQCEAENAGQWRVVAKRRADELDSGVVETVSADAVRKAAKSLLR